jgi:indolepyruvate ferredoxin oxidoreductase
MENHLAKFGEHQENQAKQFYLEEKMQNQQHRLNLMEIRRSQLNKLQRNAGFMEDWQLQGIQNWKENKERKKERELIRDYKQTITDIGTKINKANYETAVKIASIPDQIRGFGHVKEKNIKEAINYKSDLLNSFHENT